MITLDADGQFLDVDRNRPLGITATCKGQRWQYRDTESKQLYASGMTPEQFAAKFWFRNDFTYPSQTN